MRRIQFILKLVQEILLFLDQLIEIFETHSFFFYFCMASSLICHQIIITIIIIIATEERNGI